MRAASSPPRAAPLRQEPVYPCSNGEPIADSKFQGDVIVILSTEFQDLFRDDPNVAVHSDLFRYARQGNPRVVWAPDVMVIFGRPKQQRESYKQWKEEGVAPQVVINIRAKEAARAGGRRGRGRSDTRGIGSGAATPASGRAEQRRLIP